MSVGELDNCALCDRKADPRMGVYTSCGAYPLCDGCSPASNQEDVDRVAAACIARNPSGNGHGRPRFWPKASDWSRCDTCESPAPHMHPALAHEGEVEPCRDDFHRRATAENTPDRIARIDAILAGKARAR